MPTPTTSRSAAASGRPHRWALLVPYEITLAEGIAWEVSGVSPPDIASRPFRDVPEAGCVDCGEGVSAADRPCAGEMGG